MTQCTIQNSQQLFTGADLAEYYEADKVYGSGSVLMFGGDYEVTLATAGTTAIAGVVSTNPAQIMNGSLTGHNVLAIALKGRIPCNVIGPVAKGDLLESAGFGFARTNNSAAAGQIVGRAVTAYSGQGKAVIEISVS